MESTSSLCHNLVRAFEEQNGDILSLITIIDLYASEVNREGSVKEKTQFLKTLLSELQNNRDIIEKIGWDLPKSLLKFIVQENIDYTSRLRDNEVMEYVIKCFNEIALFGNAKECFLTGCELLSELEVGHELSDDDEVFDSTHPENDETERESTEDETSTEERSNSDQEEENLYSSSKADNESENAEQRPYIALPINREPSEFILEVRLHILFELINTAMKRIHTLYPSRFLAMAVGAIFNCSRNNVGSLDDPFFLLRRVYLFCRGYIPPQTTLNRAEGVSEEEKATISEDEMCLQRKLLRSLLTSSLRECFRQKTIAWSLTYYSKLKGSSFPIPENSYYFHMKELTSRCYNLALAFDIDIENEFVSHCITESKRIYQSLPQDHEIVNGKAERAISQVVYQLSYTYNMQKLGNEKNLSLDSSGVLILATQHFDETGKIIYPQIKLDSAIYMYLRFVTPGMISNDFIDYRCVMEACTFWLWVSVTVSPCSANKEAVKKIPCYLQMTFLQLLLLNSSNKVRGEERMVLFTLLTRILCLIPEQNAFEFIKDTLLSCPFENMKCCVLGILKDLMLNTKEAAGNITENLSKLNISESAKIATAPKVPPRSFVLVNEDRVASLHSLALMNIEATKEQINQSNLRLLLTYLNFFTALRQKWDVYLLEDIYKQVSDLLETQPDEDIPEFTFVKIANDNLGTLIKH